MTEQSSDQTTVKFQFSTTGFSESFFRKKTYDYTGWTISQFWVSKVKQNTKVANRKKQFINVPRSRLWHTISCKSFRNEGRTNTKPNKYVPSVEKLLHWFMSNTQTQDRKVYYLRILCTTTRNTKKVNWHIEYVVRYSVIFLKTGLRITVAK